MPVPFQPKEKTAMEKKMLLPVGEILTFRLRSFKPYTVTIHCQQCHVLGGHQVDCSNKASGIQLVRGVPRITIVAERIEDSSLETREFPFWFHFCLAVCSIYDTPNAKRGRQIAMSRLKKRQTVVQREISLNRPWAALGSDRPVPSLFRTQIGLSLAFNQEQSTQDLFRRILRTIADPQLANFSGQAKKWAKNWLKEDSDFNTPERE